MPSEDDQQSSNDQQEIGGESELNTNLGNEVSSENEDVECKEKVDNLSEAKVDTLPPEIEVSDNCSNEEEKRLWSGLRDDEGIESKKEELNDTDQCDGNKDGVEGNKVNKISSLAGEGREMKKKQRSQPTLLSLFAATNAAEQKRQKQEQLSPEEEESSNTPSAPPTVTPGPSLSSVDDFLLESDDKLSVDAPVVPTRPLTPMEQFQRRLLKHMSCSTQPVKTESKVSSTLPDASKVDDGEKGTANSLVPEEVISKLKYKPGEFRLPNCDILKSSRD